MGPSASAGKYCRPPRIRMTPISRPMKSGAVRRERPRRRGHLLLGRQRTRDRHDRHDIGEAAEQHRDAERGVVPGRVGGETSERRAVVAGRRRVGVEDFGQPARACVGQTLQRRRQHGGRRREAEDRERQDQQGQHGELHLARLDLLAEILGRAADHQPCDEHCRGSRSRACRRGPSRHRRAGSRRAGSGTAARARRAASANCAWC